MPPYYSCLKSYHIQRAALLIISRMAISGGVVALSIAWHCNLDYDFMEYCLPKYSFR